MKLASFRAEGRARFGVSLKQGCIHDLSAILPTLVQSSGDEAPTSLLALIELGSPMLRRLEALVDQIRSQPDSCPCYATTAVQFLAPVTKPSKICCLALNNSANADRIVSGPSHPAMFIKAASTLLGHGGTIVSKAQYGHVHPEPELAVVIGSLAKDVAAKDAYEHVFGYTVHNDVTSPSMRTEDTFHYRAIHPKNGSAAEIDYVDTWVSYPGRYKGCDTFSCMGPWLVTRDEIPDPHRLAVECHSNGELVTADNTANLFHKVPDVIEFLSSYMSLWPGDIISMGTALAKSRGGKPVQNINLATSGSTVSVSIERIGKLENSTLLVA